MICHVTPTVMDGIVVRWNASADDERTEISASRNKVAIDGYWSLRTEHARDEFNNTVALAYEMYRMLAKADERSPFVRMKTDDVKAWIKERGAQLVEVRFGESLAEAMKREKAEQAE